MILTLGTQFELPSPPAEIADEVELWARLSGRHATLHFVPVEFRGKRVVRGTWLVRISLKPDDRRLLPYREGRVSEPPTEDVWLHVSDREALGGYRPLNIMEMGPSGVREFLEKGDTWSGRGEFTSLMDQLAKVRASNEDMRRKVRADADESSRQREAEKRRFKFPFLPVAVDLKESARHVERDLAATPTTTEK